MPISKGTHGLSIKNFIWEQVLDISTIFTELYSRKSDGAIMISS